MTILTPSRVVIVAAIAAVLLLPGCYYMQAAGGQMQVLNKREPVEEVIASPDTPEEVARRLTLLSEARQFSIDELGLPDNGSYRTYADLGRDYVVWNVFATPEFSLEPKTWCYPIVGCVAYRGYFKEAKARSHADKLEGKGYDVAVGGVAAYSTLGRFDDPILNTMMRWDDVQIVSTLFHELAHQLLYIKDDTAFNESFATAVEEIGVRRWLAHKGQKGDMTFYRSRKALQQDMIALVDVAREDLETLYASGTDEESMRAAKAKRLARLQADVTSLLEQSGRGSSHWLTNELNNARLVPLALYEGRVPAFLELYAGCASNLDCFYDTVRALSEKPPEQRNARLDELAAAASATGDLRR